MTRDEQLIRAALEMAATVAAAQMAPISGTPYAAGGWVVSEVPRAIRAIDPAEALAKVPPALPVAYRVRVRSDDPEEWSYMSAARALDFLERNDFEAQPLYTSPTAGDHR